MHNTQQFAAAPELREVVVQAVGHAQDHLLRIQNPQGYWWGELESNTSMEAEFLLLTHFLGMADPDQWRKLTNFILKTQRADGTWGQYYGAPGDLSTTVECYFALKLAGIPAQDPRMVKAREFILSRGGVPQVRVFTKIWLALFGQWSWQGTPVMPPELILLPSWFPVNIYAFGSWARATLAPMLIILTAKPVCPIPQEAAIEELYPLPQAHTEYLVSRRPSRLLSWSLPFSALDALFRQYERLPWKPGRKWAVRRVQDWIVSHQEADGSWGGIQPPWVYSLIALKTLGYEMDHPVMAQGLRGFQGFAIEEDETLQVQACISPVWDTCLAMIALEDSGLPADHPALKRAARWILQAQIRTGGDWQVKNPRTPPGGWAFEFVNDTYPDIDDTAEVLIALRRVRLDEKEKQEEAITLGMNWLLGMQSSNGGWASFDRDNTQGFLARLPFFDFGEVLDPPSADVTAHILEALGRLEYPASSQPVHRALKYLQKEQEKDGSWFGRWGVNYVYGIGAVLPALEALDQDMGQPAARRAVDWLVAHQNPDGGWGESCASYADPDLRGQGPSTVSQTAWALLGLMAAREWTHPALERGFLYLAKSQKQDGSWDEPWFTGTGFPGYGRGDRPSLSKASSEPGAQGIELSAGFMINYHLYRNYWPLMALGRYQRYLEGGEEKSTAN